jgi:long-subunit fatty acid transport protein
VTAIAWNPAAGGDKSFAPLTLTPLTVDNFVGIVSDVATSDVTLGFAVYSPFTENLASAPSLAYHASGGSFYGEAVALSGSYRVENWLIIGGSLSFLFTHLDQSFARDTALDGCSAAPCGVEDPARAERYDLSAPFFAFPTIYAGLGLLVRAGDWTFGLAANNVFTGTAVSRTGDARVTPAGASAAVTGQTLIGFELPLTLDAGVRTRVLPDWDLVVNVRYAHLASQDHVDLRFYGDALTAANVPDWMVRYRGLRDLYWVEAGLEMPPIQRLRLGARVRVSTGAVPAEAVAIDQLDAPSLELSAGVEWRVADRIALVGGYTLALLQPRDVSASAFSPGARIACNGASYNIDDPGCAAVRAGRAIPTAAGSYLRVGNALTLGVAYDWW